MTNDTERLGTFTDVLALSHGCLGRIRNGDFDLDDWVFRSRAACLEFTQTMEDIGLEYRSPRHPRVGMGWLYRIATKATK